MEMPLLSIKHREDFSGNSANIARKSKQVPGVIYGKGLETKAILVDEKKFQTLLNKHGDSTRLSLDLDGEKHMAIIKDIQRSVKKKHIIHIDFQILTDNQLFKFALPIDFLNRDLIEKGDKIVQIHYDEVEIQTYPRFFPESVEVDLSLLQDRDNVTMEDLNIAKNENIEILEDRESTIANVVYAQEEVEKDPDAEAAEPEVIGQKEE